MSIVPSIPRVNHRAGRLWAFLQFPLTRFLLAAGPIAALIVAVLLVTKALGIDSRRASVQIALGIGAVLIYTGYVRLIEQRAVVELSPRGGQRAFGWGFAIGVGMFAAVILILWLSGAYRVEQVHSVRLLATPFVAALAAALLEETVVRGILFRILEEGLGTWLAVAVSAAIFGLLHALNPGATWVSTLAIALEAGVLLAAAYAYSRQLWLCIGLHCGWNFAEGGFGASVSGGRSHGMLSAQFHGGRLLTGGAFGPEASVAAIVAGFIVGVAFLALAWRRGLILPLTWWRPGTVTS